MSLPISPQKKKIEYVLYVRKSTESEDKQLASIDDQVAEMKRIAEQRDFEIVKIIAEEKSAKAPDKRQGYNELIQWFRDRQGKDKAWGIVCWSLDRLARNSKEGGEIIWLLQQKIIASIQTYEQEHRPVDDHMMLYIKFGMANQYSRKLSVDVSRGLRRKAERGWNPSRVLIPPYKHNKDENGNPVAGKEIDVHPEQGAIIRDLLSKMLTGNYSVPQLKREGDARGLRNRFDAPYSRTTYYQIFSHPMIAGFFYWRDENNLVKKYEGKHEALISKHEYYKIQSLLGRHGNYVKFAKCSFPFRGTMRCGKCGCAITVEQKLRATCAECKYRFSIKNRTDCPKCGIDVSDMNNPIILDKTYYRCTKKRTSCSEPYLEKQELEAQIIAIIGSFALPQDFFMEVVEILKTLHVNTASEQKNLMKQFKRKHTNLLKRRDQLANMFADGSIDEERFRRLDQAADAEILQIEAYYNKIDESSVDWFDIAENYAVFAQKALAAFQSGNDDIKTQIFSALGSNHQIQDKKLCICLPKPLLALKKIADDMAPKKARFEPVKSVVNKKDFGLQNPYRSLLCRAAHEVRTSIICDLETDTDNLQRIVRLLQEKQKPVSTSHQSTTPDG